MNLGPPGAGMNAYYYAKCLENLGNNTDAITYYHESTKLDEQSVSAWLELLDHYIRQQENEKVLQIAHHIYQSPLLHEQLDEEEKNIIFTVIK